MSINVTVSGSPVRIKRGKMVTAYDPAKAEFERRRLMRLEQVRQQSKDIAENIRNKLKKEKSKCLSQIEKDGEIKLKNWQARKLLELQNQYQEALDEIGVGHKQAICAEDEEEIFIEQQESNERIAKERGRAAAERMQIERNEDSLRKAVPIQRKKLTRDIENSRSNAVANLHKVKGKSPFKKKKKRQQQSFDSDSENKVPQLFDLGELDSVSCTCSELDEPQKSSRRKTSKEQQTSETKLQVPTSNKAAQTHMEEEIISSSKEVPMDTRISEHIKRRTRLNQPDYCDFFEKELPLKTFNKSTHCSCCQCPSRVQQHSKEAVIKYPEQSQDTINICPEPSINRLPQSRDAIVRPPQQSREMMTRPQQSLKEVSSEDTTKTNMVDKTWGRDENVKNFEREGDVAKTSEKSLREDKNVTGAVGTSDKAVSGTIRKSDKSLKEDRNLTKSRSKDVAPKKTDIPPKPKITLKSSKDIVPHFGAESNNKPVQYYDHPNRFSKQYIPSSHIEKIDEENLVVSPNVMSEDEVLEKMRQRDIEAHIRGQVALEKEKIQREYRELLKKLPALQKQERIAEIGMDKEKYHMTKERLEEMEKKRQNRLDNAYEELFVRRKPATVTLPRRKESEEVAPSLNLATWDVDFEPADSRPDIETSNKSRTEQLSHLLSNLKAQKDSLLKEIENTLSKDTLTQLTKSSYDDIKSKSTDYTQSKTKRKRSRDERAPSPSSSEINFEEESEVKTKSSKRGKDTTSVTTTGSPSPRKKAKKSKTKVLVLQNTSTQTTPKPGQSAATSPLTVPATERTEQEPCVCHKEVEDDLCEIVIKIKEDEKPEVIVNPPMMGKSVKVITEEKKMEQTQDNIQDSSREDSRRSKKSSSSTKTVQKASSWREQLSRSGSSQSTSSTSYLEPPSKSVGVLKKLGKSPEIEEISRSMDNTASSGGGGKIIDPRLLTYIKKLLNMSRASIDELTVSATSEVSTPSPSVVETPTNNPLLQLLNVMKYFNLDFADLQKQINFFSDESSVHYNTAESVTVSSSSNTSEGGRSVQFQSCTELDVNVVKSDTKGEDLGKKLIQYADIAASCTKKISNLTAMIEKVRAEKKKILQSPPTTSSDGEKDMSTTSYLALPGTSVDKEKDSSATSSPKQDDLDANLLTIDYSYAERLKQLTSEEIEIEKKRTESENPSDGELLAKLKKLVQEGDGKTVGVISQKTTVTQTKPTTEKNKDLSPFFLDIPKLPRLEAPSLEKKKKRPPPSKGLKALGGPVPHELSTIIEADSQLSTKMESSIRVTSPKSSSGSKSSSVPDILTEVQHKEIKSQSTTNSSDDVSEMETMETMLISIGMEWAIPTLKKTREALALTSSSSSSGSKKDSGEVSLREFLSKISSSSSTPGSTLSDSQSQGMSLIQVDNRRTSTPILDNLNEVKKDGGPIFLTDSDISSVREQSDGTKEKFYDLNDGSISKTG